MPLLPGPDESFGLQFLDDRFCMQAMLGRIISGFLVTFLSPQSLLSIETAVRSVLERESSLAGTCMLYIPACGGFVRSVKRQKYVTIRLEPKGKVQ